MGRYYAKHELKMSSRLNSLSRYGIFIVVYQDDLPKFIQCQPLKIKIAEALAYVLLSIFTIFGMPPIWYSDNGR